MDQEGTFLRLLTLCMTLSLGLVSVAAQARSYEKDKAALIARFPAIRVYERPDLPHASVVSGVVSSIVAPHDREQAVVEFVSRYGAVVGFEPSAMRLSLTRRMTLRVGELLVFEQRIEGLPVYDAKLIARFDRQGRLAQLSSALLPSDEVAVDPLVSETHALQIASVSSDDNPPYFAELGYLPIQGSPRLVYRVIADQPGSHRYQSFVDARSGALLYRHDLIRHHKAWVYEHNPVVDEQKLSQVELQGIVSEGEHAVHTYGEYARVASCNELVMTLYDVYCDGVTHRAVATAENDFLDVQPNLDATVFDDGFAEVMVYYTVDRINRWFRDTFGFSSGFYDAEQFASDETLMEQDFLWIYPNANYDNGFFSPGMDYPGYERPDMIVLGAIFGKDLAYDNDVVSHEFTHAVSSKAFSIGMGALDSLGLDLSAGGIEEGSADYFSSTFQGDPNLGEYVGVDRVLQNENTCPNDLMGEGHHDGQIVSGALWDIRSAIGAAKTDNLYYQTLSSHTLRTFDDLVDALQIEANNLREETDETIAFTESDVAVVNDELAARQLQGCKRLVPLIEGMEPLMQYTGFAISGDGTPSAVQYVVQSGPDTSTLTLHISPIGDVDYDVLVREGEPVAYVWDSSGYNYSWEATYDMSWNYESGSPVTQASLSESTSLVLQKETPYYFSIVCRPNMYSPDALGCRNMLTVELLDADEQGTDEPDTQGAGTGSTDDDSASLSDTENDSASEPELASDSASESASLGADDTDDMSASEDDGCGCQLAGTHASRLLLNPLSVLIDLL